MDDIKRKARSYNEAIEILRTIGTRIPGGGPLTPVKEGARFQPVQIRWLGLGRVCARNDGNVIVTPQIQSTSSGLQKQAEWFSQVAVVLAEFE